MMTNAIQFGVLLALMLISAVQPRAQQQETTEMDPAFPFIQAASLIRKPRQVTTTTLTLISSKTISSVTVTTITTKKICGVLASGVTINGITTMTTTPVVTCRRRRMYWDEPVFIAFKEDDDLELQFRQLTPSQVIRFEPTMLPEFRNSNPAPARKKVAAKPTTATATPAAIQSSLGAELDEGLAGFRVAQPIFFNQISAIVSSIVNGLLTSTTVSTSTVTYYTSTSTSTSYTATSSYYVAGACYPSGLTTC